MKISQFYPCQFKKLLRLIIPLCFPVFVLASSPTDAKIIAQEITENLNNIHLLLGIILAPLGLLWIIIMVLGISLKKKWLSCYIGIPLGIFVILGFAAYIILPYLL